LEYNTNPIESKGQRDLEMRQEMIKMIFNLDICPSASGEKSTKHKYQ
jgi:hypothetical protein